MPGDFRCHRCEYSCAFYYHFRARGCGCTGHPAFPTPSGRKVLCKARAPCVASLQLFVGSGAASVAYSAIQYSLQQRCCRRIGVAVTRHAHGDDALCHAGCLKSESIDRAPSPAMPWPHHSGADNRSRSRGRNALFRITPNRLESPAFSERYQCWDIFIRPVIFLYLTGAKSSGTNQLLMSWTR